MAGRRARPGFDLDRLLEVLNASSGVNFATLNRFPKIIHGDYLEGGLTGELMAKDIRLYLNYMAGIGVPTFSGPACLAAFELSNSMGYRDVISNRVVDAIGDLAGGVRLSTTTNRSTDMKISHGHAAGQATTQVSETFTGTVLRDPVLSGDGAPTVNSVTFPPGARTNWHTHEHGQILIVTSGRGRAANRDGAREALEPGDVVWFAPGEDHWHGAGQPGDVVWFGPGEHHWHGAGPDTVMTHIAISLGVTSWGDPVADEDWVR